MNSCFTILASTIAIALAGCAVPGKTGIDETLYYYTRSPAQEATMVMGTVAAPPSRTLSFVPDGAGPADTARIVYFDYDMASIKPEFRKTVEAHAAYLKARKQEKVALEGHTDERGGREYNLALGQRRADSVRQALILLGAKEEQIETTSWGMEKPASTQKTEAGYQLDRRVEFSYR